MISVSFFRPVDYFSGTFNRFVTWMTSGDFCHCELVLRTTPQTILDVIKDIHRGAQQGKYPEEDCPRIIAGIETNFFDDVEFRKAVQTEGTVALSFSLIWGTPMSVRVLHDQTPDSWFQYPPTDSGGSVERVDITDDATHVLNTLKFAIEELGKDYDTSGALCSWIPWTSETDLERRETYFCSEFVVTALQRIGYLRTVPAMHTTPNALYPVVKKVMDLSSRDDV